MVWHLHIRSKLRFLDPPEVRSQIWANLVKKFKAPEWPLLEVRRFFQRCQGMSLGILKRFREKKVQFFFRDFNFGANIQCSYRQRSTTWPCWRSPRWAQTCRRASHSRHWLVSGFKVLGMNYRMFFVVIVVIKCDAGKLSSVRDRSLFILRGGRCKLE